LACGSQQEALDAQREIVEQLTKDLSGEASLAVLASPQCDVLLLVRPGLDPDKDITTFIEDWCAQLSDVYCR
jgi:hypothetical protein